MHLTSICPRTLTLNPNAITSLVNILKVTSSTESCRTISNDQECSIRSQLPCPSGQFISNTPDHHTPSQQPTWHQMKSTPSATSHPSHPTKRQPPRVHPHHTPISAPQKPATMQNGRPSSRLITILPPSNPPVHQSTLSTVSLKIKMKKPKSVAKCKKWTLTIPHQLNRSPLVSNDSPPSNPSV